jgi:serine phosphatase RsbU (regulator of sigma subunit)
MEDRLHKLRMSHELAIAKNLQDTFINSFVDGLPLHLNASLFYRYEAAEECAGDWYASHFDHQHNCLTIAIADVSGHGVSSAMFTAIIAALYDERINEVSKNHMDLLEAIHLRLRHLAPDRMHATFQIVTWFPDEKLLKVSNAGHPFPFLERDENGVRTSEMIKIMSTPLGIFDSPVTSTVTISVPESFRLLLYTDGLTEGRSENLGVVFGNKKLREAFTNIPSVNGQQRLDYIMQCWRNHMGKRAASDDICLLLLEARNSDSMQKVV